MRTSNLAPGDVAVVELPGGEFGACQVVRIESGAVAAIALDRFSASRPALAELSRARPLLLDHHQLPSAAAGIMISHGAPPPEWDWIGRLPVAAAEQFPGFSGWDYLPAQMADQRRWDRLPAAVRREYRAGTTRGPVEVDLGKGPVVLGPATGRLDPALVPLTETVRWPGLDQLPCCTSITWAGADRGLVDALASRPVVSSLSWRDPPRELDLRATGLTSLTVTGDVDRLLLPEALTALTFEGGRLREVVAAAEGRWMSLVAPLLPAGLSGLRRLVLTGPGSISVAPLAGLSELRSLALAWNRAPGRLDDAATLASMPRLAHLTLNHADALDGSTLPELPALTALTVHGLRKTAAAAIRKRYRDQDVDLKISGVKNDPWPAADLSNPLRDWGDDDARAGAAAGRAFAAAVRAVDARPADPAVCLRLFVDALNRIDDRYQMIDTLRRDQAAEAFLTLAVRAGVPAERADEWFDEWRSF